MTVQVRSGKHGKHLLAACEFKPGESILQLRGKPIPYSVVAKKRKPDNALQVSARRYINLAKPGVYANHSCKPNAGITSDLQLIALKSIAAGEEITFDYSTTMDGETGVQFVCSCAAENCRREILGFPWLSVRLQKYYVSKGVVQPFLIKK